ncbi:MAG: NINE protein [Saprospiraceae bacterium]|nr:NINE protein [Saprospiraceae bacterium]
MKNKIIAALLAFIGGTFGIHKFYLRDPGAGVFYIFLTFMTSRFFPIATILGFIDGLRYLMMSPEEFDRKFNRKYYREKPRSSRRTRRRPQKEEYYEVQEKTRTKSRPRKIRSNPFKKSGLRKYKEYEIEEAIEDFKKGLKIQPDDLALRFNLACAYSLLENKEEAFRYLDEAVQKGMTNYEKITSHDDLAFLRIQPEFEAFRKNGFRLSKESAAKEERPMDDILLAQLNRLMELRKKGVLTENEYVVERKKILNR